MTITLRLIATCVATLSPCLANSENNWPTFGGNPQHTGQLDLVIGDQTPQRIWKQSISESELNQVCIGDGRVFVTPMSYRYDTKVTALNAKTGESLWTRWINPDAFSISPPSFHDGKVLFQRCNHRDDSQLWCLNGETGNTEWSAPISAQWERYEAPTISDGKIWTNGGSYGGIYGFEFQTGSELFHLEIGQEDRWSPAFYQGKVYSWVFGNFREHSPSEGTILRQIKAADTLFASNCALANGRAYAMADRTLYAINLDSFEVDWSKPDLSQTTPAISDNQVITPTGSKLNVYDPETGTLLKQYLAPAELQDHQPIITNDKVIAGSENETYIFDKTSTTPQHTIPAGGRLSRARGILYIADTNGTLGAWQIAPPSPTENFPPTANSDSFRAYQDTELTVSSTGSWSPLIGNDYDLNNSPLTARLVSNAQNGTAAVNADGSFSYLPNQGFHGEDSFSYSVSNGVAESTPTTVSLEVVDTSKPYIVISVSKDGIPIQQGQPVSGVITGTVTIHNSLGYHPQFYKNFRTLRVDGHGHYIDSIAWTKTFSLDTSEFFDGENLLSVHAHPHNQAGMPYTTVFYVGLFKLWTSNNNPAPNGDTLLPQINIDPSVVSIFDNGMTVLSTTRDGAFDLYDDTGSLEIDDSSHRTIGGQVIPHLGASVLGRRRWGGSNPPFGDRELIRGVRLLPFQKNEPEDAQIVIFFNDEVGRANYAFLDITIPAISPEQRIANPMPTLDAHILNASQGQTIIVPDEGEYDVEVFVTGADAEIRSTFDTLFVWVGNLCVAKADLNPHFDNLQEGETSFILTIPIPSHQIRRLEESRTPGHDSSAFAMWLDFSTGSLTDINLPASEHVHLDSIRTESRPWPYPNYTIELSGDLTNGQITQNDVTVEHGESTTLRIEANYGFSIDEIMINDVLHPLTEINTSSYDLVLSNVTQPMDIEVNFKYNEDSDIDRLALSQNGETSWQVHVFGKTGYSYQLERANGEINWELLGEPVPGTNTLLLLVDPNPPESRMLYRVREQQN